MITGPDSPAATSDKTLYVNRFPRCYGSPGIEKRDSRGLSARLFGADLAEIPDAAIFGLAQDVGVRELRPGSQNRNMLW